LSDDENRRDSTRVEAAFRVRYRTLDELVVAYTQDLSRGGTFLRSQKFLPINAVVRLHLELPEGGGEISAIARVAFVRGNDEAQATGKPAGMGVQFLDLEGEATGRIEQFITERTQLEVEKVEKSGPIHTLRRLKVLVVDDEDSYRELAAAAIRERGHDVRLAMDGLEALGLCLKEPPELVVTDVQMPRMDGWQLLRVIRARSSLAAIPVVFVTTLGGDEERLRGYQLGVDDYVVKPYAPGELAARVERVIIRGGHDKKSLRGDLDQVALSSVLSFLELERKTGVLMVVGQTAVRLHLRDGRLLRAERDHGGGGAPSPSLDILTEVLSWTTGQFEFAGGEVACQDELNTSITALLIDFARIKDEMAR
jgi:uncharacterized protein (TIGR02266 family)